MIGLIFATRWEARPFLMLGEAEQVAEQPVVVYRTPYRPRMRIAISRIGKVAAAAACQTLILAYQADRIINAGACGALHDRPELGIGRLVHISDAVEGDHEVFGKSPQPVPCRAGIGRELPGARLVTNDRPVFDPRMRTYYGALADVVDMEGAAIARVAALNGVSCEMIKGITDQARQLDRKTLSQNLNLVCEEIAQWLWNNLGAGARSDD